MKKYNCCFSGHRKLPKDKEKEIEKDLKKEILRLIQRGFHCFYAGGALGFDTLAAEKIQEIKTEYPDIQLKLVLPCLNQAEHWKKEEKEEYEKMKSLADEIIYISEVYYRGCMQKRNRYMVDHSVICLCYLTETSGGTKYTIDYCKKQGKEIINLARKDEI